MEHRGAALPLAVLGDAGNAVQGVPRSQVTQALHFLEDRDSPAVGMCVDGSDFRSGITTTKWSANAVRTTDEVTTLALPTQTRPKATSAIASSSISSSASTAPREVPGNNPDGPPSAAAVTRMVPTSVSSNDTLIPPVVRPEL